MEPSRAAYVGAASAVQPRLSHSAARSRADCRRPATFRAAGPSGRGVMTDLLDEPVTAVRRPATFEELVHATGDRLLRTAMLLTGEREAAEDLVQSAYAQAFARWRLVSRADNPAAYTR